MGLARRTGLRAGPIHLLHGTLQFRARLRIGTDMAIAERVMAPLASPVSRCFGKERAGQALKHLTLSWMRIL